MARLSRSKQRSRLRFNMTPLIDVTFLLIIFAVLVSHFAQQEAKLLRLPKADQAQEKERVPQRLVVTIPRSGIITIGGKTYRMEELEDLFQRKRSKNPGLTVQVRADGEIPYRIIKRIMFYCARSGIWQVSFAVEKQREEVIEGEGRD